MAELNQETYQFLNFFCLVWIFDNGDSINENKIIISKQTENDDNEEKSEWEGFVKTMKKFIKRNVVTQMTEMDSKIDKITEDMRSMAKTLDEIKNKLN